MITLVKEYTNEEVINVATLIDSKIDQAVNYFMNVNAEKRLNHVKINLGQLENWVISNRYEPAMESLLKDNDSYNWQLVARRFPDYRLKVMEKLIETIKEAGFGVIRLEKYKIDVCW